jgi:acyl carrier protein
MGLARGYLGKPALTAGRFLPDPFSDRQDARLYRTGDVVRFLLDGNLEFLGRVDNQVKLRGYRIELDEIQAVLAEHPAVRECAVLVRGDHDQRLVAYLVPNAPGSEIDAAQLRRHVQDRMPDYMVPAMFVTLDALPLTLNGKIDRAALPEPSARHAGAAQDHAAPRNALERALAEIFAQVLKLDRVGIHDNFFDLGGHSLLMTQVASRVRDRMHLELPLRRFMEAPTIAELTTVLQHEAPAPAPAAHKTTIPRLDRKLRTITVANPAGRTGPGTQE